LVSTHRQAIRPPEFRSIPNAFWIERNLSY
jgi:hypothetical protein